MPASGTGVVRSRVIVHGIVQGVGFRPFVFRLASRLGLTGWIGNDGDGVTIEVEGARDSIGAFVSHLRSEAPPLASIHDLTSTQVEPTGASSFVIRASTTEGPGTAMVPPDIATCAQCVHELFDPGDRRYRYPFVNCTNCGPRYSILHTLPYDRPNTSMRAFPMCDCCRVEYETPVDRRYHAQPIACAECGPMLSLCDDRGGTIASSDEALIASVRAIRNGAIVAVKGLGGFHLVCDARSDETVLRLRERKLREEKPFAIMMGPLAAVCDACRVTAREADLLSSPASPIVLLDRRGIRSEICESVAPKCPSLGVMLPSTPLHHLLIRELSSPIVATSGNRSDEPLCIANHEALERLAGIADLYLVHDRPIVRPLDDSITRVVCGCEQVVRRARGFTPLPIRVNADLPKLLAVGGHQKNTVAISFGQSICLSQHLGDLDTIEGRDRFEDAIDDLKDLYAHAARGIVCDQHPDYASTRYAERRSEPLVRVQHHEAHVISCMAEHHLDGPLLGVSWDGTGFGPDGTVWGGEFLRVNNNVERVAHLGLFGLPGADLAVREPRRSAIAVLTEVVGLESLDGLDLDEFGWDAHQLGVVCQMLRGGFNTPRTSSAGRFFDAAASLLGIRQICSFEGQAAMELEYAASRSDAIGSYPIELHGSTLDWRPAIVGLCRDRAAGTDRDAIAARFHHTLVDGIELVARRTGLERVVLSGGCFQNRFLLERTIYRLRNAGFMPFWHQRVPSNDGGLALGQIVAAARCFAGSAD